MQEDETLDLVNNQDKVIGTIQRSQYDEMVQKKLGYFRAADAFITNKDGKLWIPRRRETKRIAPNGLDYSMGEHVQSGEDYITACIRGFAEELNLQIGPDKLKLLNKFIPELGLPAYFQTLFLYHGDDAPNYNPDDFSEYYWLTPNELIKKLESGEPAKSSLLRAVKYLETNRIN